HQLAAGALIRSPRRRGRAMRAWIDRTNDGLSGTAGAARRLGYINNATGRKEPAVASQTPVSELGRQCDDQRSEEHGTAGKGCLGGHFRCGSWGRKPVTNERESDGDTCSVWALRLVLGRRRAAGCSPCVVLRPLALVGASRKYHRAAVLNRGSGPSHGSHKHLFPRRPRWSALH